MASRNNARKNDLVQSITDHALSVLRQNKVEKVFVTKSGYVFVNESDARAFVGKDGHYFPVTENSRTESKEEVIPPAGAPEKKAAKAVKTADPVIDEHKKAEQ